MLLVPRCVKRSRKLLGIKRDVKWELLLWKRKSENYGSLVDEWIKWIEHHDIFNTIFINTLESNIWGEVPSSPPHPLITLNWALLRFPFPLQPFAAAARRKRLLLRPFSFQSILLPRDVFVRVPPPPRSFLPLSPSALFRQMFPIPPFRLDAPRHGYFLERSARFSSC